MYVTEISRNMRTVKLFDITNRSCSSIFAWSSKRIVCSCKRCTRACSSSLRSSRFLFLSNDICISTETPSSKWCSLCSNTFWNAARKYNSNFNVHLNTMNVIQNESKQCFVYYLLVVSYQILLKLC